MDSDNAVTTYHFITRVTVQVSHLCWVLGAEECLPQGGNEGGHILCQRAQAYDFVAGKLLPLLVGFLAALAHEATGTAVAGCFTLLALLALGLAGGAHLLENVLNVKQVEDVECSLEARDSTWGQHGGLATVRAVHTLSLLALKDQWLETLLTEDVEALEELWLCVGLQTDTTGDLLLDLLESSFSGRRFGSHS